MKTTQKSQILAYMQTGNTITPIEALNKFGCFRLSDVIFRLRQSGHEIIKHDEPNTHNSGYHARYELKGL
ncbi:Helix-turn-helix domain-containing protein [Acinetobacter marinus]|uniref:Helix-turn-helix domain-containing protein n=1 Tax=Acinetobacter marinus TaxID=281375 RepID=A0A1G6IE56_9GAMM|nr:helix-turn-helix domain-containing protein [Acinetobacter marinus]SDC04832.1 Helix-turn-helix domain-containing protein [Acinetobacter marinus]